MKGEVKAQDYCRRERRTRRWKWQTTLVPRRDHGKGLGSHQHRAISKPVCEDIKQQRVSTIQEVLVSPGPVVTISYGTGLPEGSKGTF